MQGVQTSPVRELLKLAQRPDIISFAGGLPDPELIDTEGLAEATAYATGEQARHAWQYGTTEGFMPLREQIVRLMATRGASVTPAELLVTTGSQQGIDLIGRVMLDPGDVVVVERPTYLAALQVFGLYQARVEGIEGDAEGMRTDLLEAFLERERPKMIYLITNFSNPTGATLSLERRRHLLELAARHGVMVIEDDPYGELVFDAQASLPPLWALADEVPGAKPWTVYLSSLSKIVAPGLRVAWMALPEWLYGKVTIAKQATDLHTSTLSQATAAHYLASDRLHARLPHMRATYREKAGVLMSALRSRLGGAITFEEPRGGMFVWARFAGGVDASVLAPRAIASGVMFLPGHSFFAGEPDHARVRLSYSLPDRAGIEEGVRRLASVMD
nr:PLP-dependent aminotransferase family protein [Deinobacterium chartae]